MTVESGADTGLPDTRPTDDRVSDDRARVTRTTGAAVLVGGIVGLVAAFVLTVERFRLLVDPAYVPSCSLNPVLSCGSVMTTSQAAIFGFPNPLLGIVGFTVVVVTGVLVLASVDLPRWFWVGLTLGLSAGVVLVHWLIFQSLYRIGALCPYCMAVWAVTIPLWVVSFDRALGDRAEGLRRWKWTIVVLWFTAVILLCAERFWSYWSTLL